VPMLTADLRLALDSGAFARACGIQDLDPWQLNCLEVDAQGNRDQILCCTRQGGKSTVAGLVAARVANFEPGSLTVCASPSQDQSDELLGVITEFLDSLGAEMTLRSVSRLKLRNGARIVAKHGLSKTVRGLAGVRLLLLDEAARVPPDLIEALTPMLAVKNGRLVALSTPAGRNPDNWFAITWHDREQTGYHRVMIRAPECPRLSPEWLEKEKKRLGVQKFEQEYMCAFVDDGAAAFPSALIEGLFSDDVRPLFDIAA
jgi:Terminase large subunit, T4likevirus-type, N-terminal